MLFQIVMWLEEDGTWLVIHRNGSFHQNEVSYLWYIYLHCWSVADPIFPRGARAKSLGGVGGGASTYDFPKFPQKLHLIATTRWKSFKKMEG